MDVKAAEGTAIAALALTPEPLICIRESSGLGIYGKGFDCVLSLDGESTHLKLFSIILSSTRTSNGTLSVSNVMNSLSPIRIPFIA